MEDNPKSDLWQLVVAFIGSICVAVGWFMANLFPDQVPQSLAELFAAVVTALVIGVNILVFVALGAAIRRRQVPPPAIGAASNGKQFGAAGERLIQFYFNIHGSVWVAVVAILCITVVAMYSINAATTAGPAAADVTTRRMDVSPQAGGGEQPVQPAHEAPQVYQAEGFGIAGADARTGDQRRRTAIQAAEIDAAATLLEQIVGAIYARIMATEDGQIDRDSIEKVVRGWLPTRAQTIAESYDEITGEATITLQLVLSEAALQEVRQRALAAR